MSSSSFYKQFDHLRIRLNEIVSATDNFSDSNLIRSDRFGKEYKGQLLRSGQLVDIVAWRLDDKHGKGHKEFWTEVTMLSKLKHKNIICMVGFCDEKGENIVINKHETGGNLYDCLRDPALTWMRRLQICVGAARALSYIHYDKGRDFSVIHRDLKSSKILLADDWEAKLSGFELSITQTSARRKGLCLTKACGTLGYCDPTYLGSGTVTHKSDMYSFGIVLFEVLCGKEVRMVDNDNSFLVSTARSYYEGGRLKDMIDEALWKQMNTKSFNIFSETAYYCLKEQRQQRPDIYQIIIKLEQALASQREHENPLISKAYSMVGDTTTNSLKGKDLKHLEIPLTDIELATENFGKTYLIGSGGYGDVYKAELDHLDSQKYFTLEEKSVDELPKKRSIVAIKRIKIREDEEGEKGFLAEIEMLTSCKHPNIISLHGFCEEGSHLILVYEHASKGSLSDYLGSTGGKLTNLSWVQRIKICIDIARGLNYLHTKIEDDRRIIHRDIKSDNILLSENWQAKIADFGLSRLSSETENKTLYTETLAGTNFYWDPEYFKTGKLKNESDIYSFGVVLFEIMSGKLAYDAIYTNENINGIAPVARLHFNEGTIREMVDPRLMEETQENIFTLNRGPDKDSLDAFAEIAYRCVAESQAERPTAEDVIKKLEEALYFQENIKDHLKFSLAEIVSATHNFSGAYSFGSRGLYKGEVTHSNGRHIVALKRFDGGRSQGEKDFLSNLQVLLEYKHENIIGLVGYCNEMDERIIVYEYASRGGLHMHLKDNDLTWRKRLEICIDIANGLDFLHGGSVTQEVVIHRHIKSSHVLLTDDWKAKITDFGLSLISAINKDMDFIIDDARGSPGYVDPLYVELGFLTEKSDIYSLGVVLFEILCGRTALVRHDYSGLHAILSRWVKHNFKLGTLYDIVFQGIKEQIAPKSFTTFLTIAYQCLHERREERPTTGEVLLRLKEALEFQEDYDIWKPKVPEDYENLIQMSNSRESHSAEKYKDLYDMFSRGILLKEGKVCGNGERNEMISATKFSYQHRWSHKWRSIPESRFHKVAKMSDISNLKIRVKIKPQFLSHGHYSVNLIFKFCESSKSEAEQKYVNLKYKMGSETLHTYFATWREDGWMMIELCRFLNHTESCPCFNNYEDTDFEFLLESFSRSYCESRDIYIQGIEFRAMDNVEHEESKNLKEVQQVQKSNLNMDQVEQSPTNFGDLFWRFINYGKSEELVSQNKVNKKKSYMLPAKEVLYQSFDVKLFNSTPSAQSRFQDVIELARQQVFHIKCKIEGQRLSPDTEYTCYLVFKLSEKCHGLHCPVIVRDLLKRKNKKKRIVYFRSPNPCNVNDIDQVPVEREDGWMEVNVWRFNSSNEIQDDCVSINLKLISYEGTMSGLIISGLEFQPL
ncbi:hypothetical protein Lser_V15G01736 [Lactuca serriola]